ncbi:hypothetical protein LptCag_1589 [Leptospirillum ferriphilum]|uniref:Type 4 secretion system PilS N-terminal domain-containing protein n=1 Tax=Leptospirillum ferriphilum TaxID=178606 RepID=A0A094X5Q9_9BACT|nr:hypothetical protein LptCag_1589 [Leptospirillum ferriphilum]
MSKERTVSKKIKNVFEKIRKKINEKGFDNIQLGAYLFISSLLVVGAIYGIRAIISNGKTAATRMQVDKLVTIARNYGSVNAGQPNGTYYGLGSYVASGYVPGSTSSLPENYTASGVKNPWGGFGIITNAVNGNPYMFSVSESGLPEDACSQMANYYSLTYVASCSGGVLTLTGE